MTVTTPTGPIPIFKESMQNQDIGCSQKRNAGNVKPKEKGGGDEGDWKRKGEFGEAPHGLGEDLEVDFREERGDVFFEAFEKVFRGAFMSFFFPMRPLVLSFLVLSLLILERAERDSLGFVFFPKVFSGVVAASR